MNAFLLPSHIESSQRKLVGTKIDSLAGSLFRTHVSVFLRLDGAEMSAVLKYNLDLHLAGNRCRWSSSRIGIRMRILQPKATPDTPTTTDRDARWQGLTEFINYALSTPEVRTVSAKAILA